MNTNMITKKFANFLLKEAIQQLQHATTPKSLKYRILAARINQRTLKKHGYWWQVQRIENWIHYYQKRMKVLCALRTVAREREIQ